MGFGYLINMVKNHTELKLNENVIIIYQLSDMNSLVKGFQVRIPLTFMQTSLTEYPQTTDDSIMNYLFSSQFIVWCIFYELKVVQFTVTKRQMIMWGE